MLVLTCPACHSDLVEEGFKGELDCISCGNEFLQDKAGKKYMNFTEIHQRLQALHEDHSEKQSIDGADGREMFEDLVKKMRGDKQDV